MSTWHDCLDEYLLDAGAYTRWLRDECRDVDVDPDSVRTLAGRLSMRVPLKATPPWSVAELQCVMLTDAAPTVVMAARAVLREHYMAAKSSEVGELVWARQEAREREPFDDRVREADAEERQAVRGEWHDRA